MTLQDEFDDVSRTRQFLALAVTLALLLGSYKVWNERQMTHEYHGWRVAQERSAVALEAIAATVEAKPSGLQPALVAASEKARNTGGMSVTLPTLGGAALCYKHGFASAPVACGDGR